MPELELLASGEGDYRLHDPAALRVWMLDRKRRDFVDKTTTAAEALVPTLNPDVGIAYAHRADIHGNARCFGPAIGRTAKP